MYLPTDKPNPSGSAWSWNGGKISSYCFGKVSHNDGAVPMSAASLGSFLERDWLKLLACFVGAIDDTTAVVPIAAGAR